MGLDQHGNELGKIFVGGLHQSTTNESLENYFSNFGEIEEALVMMDNVTSRSRGFGYVKFKDPLSVDNVMSQKQHIIDLKEVDPKRCNINMKGKNRRLLKIFVGGIAISHDEEIIRNFFSQFGHVTEVNLLASPEKDRHRGFAFVGFKDEAVVKYLISLHFLVIKGKQVEIKAMEPPSLHKKMPGYPNNKLGNGSLALRNAIFGKVAMKNPIYRTSWMDWNGFSQTPGPNDWSNSNMAYPPNPQIDTTGFPQNPVSSAAHPLHAMMWQNVAPTSNGVDPVAINSSSQANLYSSNQNSTICHQPQLGYTQNRGRSWLQRPNRNSNQTHSSYFIDQQQTALMHGLNRNNGSSNWNQGSMQGNNWSSSQNQGFPAQSNIQSNHPSFMNNTSHTQGQSRQGNGVFENWSSINHQLNNITNSNLHHHDQINHQANANPAYSHNQFNRYMNWSNSGNQFNSQKSIYPDEIVSGSSAYSTQQGQQPSASGHNHHQFAPHQNKNSRISSNYRRSYQKNYISSLSSNGMASRKEPSECKTNANNDEQFPDIESTVNLSMQAKANGRETTTSSSLKMNSSSNSSIDSQNGDNTAIRNLPSASLQNGTNKAIISSSTSNQIPIPSH